MVIQIPWPFARRRGIIIMLEDVAREVPKRRNGTTDNFNIDGAFRVLKNNDCVAATGEWPRDLDHDRRVELRSRARVDFDKTRSPKMMVDGGRCPSEGCLPSSFKHPREKIDASTQNHCF